MITWDYRVFREADGGLSIREAFYAEDGRVLACSEPVAGEAASINELTELLDDWRRALDHPVLTLTDLPAPPAGQPRPRPGRRPSLNEVRRRLGLDSERPEQL